MAPFPDFQNATTFPPFLSCPLADALPPQNQDTYFLVGSIQENMTLTPRTPTFICRDRDGISFAVTIKLPPGDESFDVKPFKKGLVVVVRGARRSGVREENAEVGQKAKQGFVEVGREVVGVSFLFVECLVEGGR
jgi:hypothetical protein